MELFVKRKKVFTFCIIAVFLLSFSALFSTSTFYSTNPLPATSDLNTQYSTNPGSPEYLDNDLCLKEYLPVGDVYYYETYSAFPSDRQ